MSIRHVCEPNRCIGCKNCINLCPKKCVSLETHPFLTKAIIDTSRCINCGICENNCPVNNVPPKHEIIESLSFNRKEVKQNSSSSGLCSDITRDFLLAGGIVVGSSNDGFIHHEIIENVSEFDKFAGSKYVQSDMGQVVIQIKRLLLQSKKVLFIGTPCQVAAVKLATKNSPLLYTIGVICHGVPSAKILDTFLQQEVGLSQRDNTNITFRNKRRFGIFVNGRPISGHSCVTDPYSLLYLNNLIFLEGCYDCEYATKGRCEDLTVGDNWIEKVGCSSTVLINNEKGRMLAMSVKDTYSIGSLDVQDIIKTNHQLLAPAVVNIKKREKLKRLYASKLSIRRISRKLLPIPTIRQRIKKAMIICKIKKA